MLAPPRFVPSIVLLLAAAPLLNAGPPPTQPASLRSPVALDDQAGFALYRNEEKLMTMHGKLAGGNYDGQATLSLAGQTATWKTKVTAGADGRWTKIELDLPQGPVSIEARTAGSRGTIGAEPRLSRSQANWRSSPIAIPC